MYTRDARLSTTKTGVGALPCSSFKPSCCSIMANTVTPSDPARDRTWNGVNLTSKSQ